MKKYIQAIFLLLFVCLLFSCRYAKPLITSRNHIKDDSVVVYDTFLGQKNIIESWFFPCLRTGIHRGAYSITKVYDKQNHLVEKIKYKRTWSGCCDLPCKVFSKQIYYDTLGVKTNVTYEIGHGGYHYRKIRERTIYYQH
jgi:hypothetical protein